MQDFTSSVAAQTYGVLEAVREIEFRKRVWNGRLRELRAADRAKAKARTERTVIVSKPGHLAGIHRI